MTNAEFSGDFDATFREIMTDVHVPTMDAHVIRLTAAANTLTAQCRAGNYDEMAVARGLNVINDEWALGQVPVCVSGKIYVIDEDFVSDMEQFGKPLLDEYGAKYYHVRDLGLTSYGFEELDTDDVIKRPMTIVLALSEPDITEPCIALVPDSDMNLEIAWPTDEEMEYRLRADFAEIIAKVDDAFATHRPGTYMPLDELVAALRKCNFSYSRAYSDRLDYDVCDYLASYLTKRASPFDAYPLVIEATRATVEDEDIASERSVSIGIELRGLQLYEANHEDSEMIELSLELIGDKPSTELGSDRKKRVQIPLMSVTAIHSIREFLQ